MIWIDVVNQPHVRFWRRFLHFYRGDVLITVRDKGNLAEMAELFLGDVLTVGRWGKDRLDKLLAFAERVKELTKLVQGRVNLALSKASPELARVAFGLGIKSVIANDNDLPPYTVSKLTFPLASLVLIPECYSGPTFSAKDRRFSGTFEVSHVLDYLERGPVKEFGLEEEYMVARPPPKSFYLDMPSDWFVKLVRKVSRELRLKVVYIPREGERPEGFIIPEEVVDGIDLIRGSALVLGAGGTMTREAALLGKPTVSLFPLKGPCVTDILLKEGLMIRGKPSLNVEELKDLMKEEREEKVRDFLRRSEDPAKVLAELASVKMDDQI